ncbi:hypothetical protein Tco_0351736 [Tanacetum coccineum]
MADSWKFMNLNKFLVKDGMIDYILHKYMSNWQVHDVIADDILDDLLKRELEKQQRVKCECTRNVLSCMLWQKKEVIIIESDASCDYNPFQATFDESSDHNPFQATSDESSDHNPFQATYDESYDHNPFQVSSNDTLNSSSWDTCSSDSTWEQKKKLVKWYDDLSSDELRTIYKGRPGSSSRKAAITKPDEPKSRSKHLAPITPRTWSTCTTLVVPTKFPPPVKNYVLGFVAVTTWQQILNKEFRIKRSKEDVRRSSDVRMKCKRKML